MSIFFIGDTHADIDIKKVTTKVWPEQRALSKDDLVIVLGDFGAVWDNGKQDRYIQKWWESKTFSVAFIDGNHENHDVLDGLEIEEWNGGFIHRVGPQNSIIHLMRGQVYDLAPFMNGKSTTIFTMGGAASTDKEYRKEGRSWWARELPSEIELETGIENLEKHNWKVDFVLTHDCGRRQRSQFGYESTTLNTYIDFVLENTNHSLHCFGHHHIDRWFGDKSVCLYNEILEIEDTRADK